MTRKRLMIAIAVVCFAVPIGVVSGLLSGWERTAEDPTFRPGELAAVGGLPCPDRLPNPYDTGDEDEVDREAFQRPALLDPQRAWTCLYDIEITRGDGSARMDWVLVGEAEERSTDDLAELATDLGGLEPLDGPQECNADLGPRWMVVYERDGDLTGVVVDQFGCRDVRLTDEPHTVPAGSRGRDGVVVGRLEGGFAVLDVEVRGWG